MAGQFRQVQKVCAATILVIGLTLSGLGISELGAADCVPDPEQDVECGCNYDFACEGGGESPGDPHIRIEPTMGPSVDAYVCTGTHHAVATGTGEVEIEGGFIVGIHVSYSVTVDLLEQVDFACDYGMMISAFGDGGVQRLVHLQVEDTDTGERVNVGPSCGYDGVFVSFCNIENYPFIVDSAAGFGYAGPLGGGFVAPLPMKVTICPVEEPFYLARAWNDNAQGVPFTGVEAADGWICQEFPIHYT